MDNSLPFIKVERLKKLEHQQKLKELKESLPVFQNLREVTLYRLPYHEALIAEAKEKGFPSTSEYIKEMLEFQENIRNKYGAASFMWSKPRLKESKSKLNLLLDGLSKAERAHIEKNESEECNQFISLAAHFSFNNPDWIWLGEQIFLRTINVTLSSVTTGGKHEAIARFLYGKFLLENVGINETVKMHLNKAKDLSNGTHWTAKRFLPELKDLIYYQILMLLHEIYLHEARLELKRNPVNAKKLAKIAEKRAAEACLHFGQTEAMSIIALSYLLQDDINSALETACNLFRIYRVHSIKKNLSYVENLRRVVELYRNGEIDEAFKFLINIDVFTTTKPMPHKIIYVYQVIGDYMLKHNNFSMANNIYQIILEQLYKRYLYNEAQEVLCFSGVSKGRKIKFVQYSFTLY